MRKPFPAMLRVSLYIVLAGMIAACDSSEEACAPFSGADEAFRFTATIDGDEREAVVNDAQLRALPIPEEGDVTNPDDKIWTLTIRAQFAYPLERGEECPPSERCETVLLSLNSFSEFCATESYALRNDQAPAPSASYSVTENGESTTYRTPLDGVAGQVTLDALDAGAGVVEGTFEAPLVLWSDAEERIDVEGSFRSPLEFLQD